MIDINQIDAIIDKSSKGISKLNESILSIWGMSSAINRHLLNNLGEDRSNYFEIGINKGSTFISAMYGNNMKGIAVDNWSQYNDDNPKQMFIDNCNLYGIEYTLFEQDAFSIGTLNVKDIDFYLYDGDHFPDKTTKALTYFYDSLANEFLYIVDDYDWIGVREGTKQGIKECNLRIKYYKYLESNIGNNAEGWWNGLGIFILKK